AALGPWHRLSVRRQTRPPASPAGRAAGRLSPRRVLRCVHGNAVRVAQILTESCERCTGRANQRCPPLENLRMSAENVSRARTWKRLAWPLRLTAVVQAARIQAPRAGQDSGSRPRVDADGVAHVPAMSVPPSRFMSPEARSRFIKLFSNPEPSPPAGADIRLVREHDERKNAPFVARAQALYPVNIEERVIGGVRTRVITPKAGVAARNRDRVLVNLHGGGFLWGEGNGALTESIPIAGVGKITVITVAYRLAPEFKFPAASEDVASVYRELLKEHRAADIGIYGCSAGGMLTAEAVAWFQQEKLPQPGAIGTFCGSAGSLGGDSSHLASLLVGESP